MKLKFTIFYFENIITETLTTFIFKAGDGVMSIDYLGQTFKGDLLPNGQIKSQETGMYFKNPSAWAIYCKKIVNPSKKSGCGWASVKYKGRKMDHFKALWSSKIKALRAAETVDRAELEDGSNSSDIEVIQEIHRCEHICLFWSILLIFNIYN